MSNGKKILLGIVLLIIFAGVAGYMMWNKPHKEVADISGVEVSTAELTSAYEADETAANQKYLDKAIQVTGTVTGIEQNQDGYTLVILDEDVQCTMKDKNISVATGDKLTVKGFCSGSSLFGVVLRDCIIVK